MLRDRISRSGAASLRISAGFDLAGVPIDVEASAKQIPAGCN